MPEHAHTPEPDAVDVVILTGEGCYCDPWHDFAGTSQRAAELLRDQGLRVTVAGIDSDPAAIGTWPRLVVVNAGGGAQETPAQLGGTAERWREAVIEHALAGRPLLALHATTSTFHDDNRWPQIIGGRWVRDVSMHPPYAPATVQVTDIEHPITAGLSSIDIDDERYSFLEMQPDVVPLITHEHDGVTHPLVWTHPVGFNAPLRVVVDCLGHDIAAYGDVRADLLKREVDWLLA